MLAKGLQDAGTGVIDIGLIGTEEIFFATLCLKVDGGIEVTTSYNSVGYDCVKQLGEEPKLTCVDTGLRDIQMLTQANIFRPLMKTNAAAISSYQC